jgi:methylated-DNA-[protein]-cysteine S-methyltransferase
LARPATPRLGRRSTGPPLAPGNDSDAIRVSFPVMTLPWRFAVRPTSLGAIGVAWSEHGIARTWLHAGSVDRARVEIRSALPRASETVPPPAIAAALEDIRLLLDGDRPRLAEPELDMRDIPDFDRRVYEVARTIPPGSTMTYGEIAKALGEEPMRARDVGIALSRNPFAPIVPCHRVVAAGGRLGGYSAPGGTSTKRRLLEIEGAAIVAPPAQGSLFDLG